MSIKMFLHSLNIYYIGLFLNYNPMRSNSYILVAENLPPLYLITFNALVHQLLTQMYIRNFLIVLIVSCS